MSIPTKLWIALCAAILWSAAWWYGGYHVADSAWSKRDAERKLADAKASAELSEKYRAREKKLNEHIGEIETRAINDAANAEMEYQSVMDKLRNAGANATDRLRIKPVLACRAVSNNSSTSNNGDEEVQTGLSPEIAGRIIGVGAECDKVVASLDACQSYIESLRNEKPIE